MYLAGTDADIKLEADGQSFDLSYDAYGVAGDSTLAALFSYNDFERDSRAVYTVGPFTTLPNEITIRNDAPDAGDIFDAFTESFVSFFVGLGDSLRNLGLSIIGGHADYVGENSAVFQPDDLNKLGVNCCIEECVDAHRFNAEFCEAINVDVHRQNSFSNSLELGNDDEVRKPR